MCFSTVPAKDTQNKVPVVSTPKRVYATGALFYNQKRGRESGNRRAANAARPRPLFATRRGTEGYRRERGTRPERKIASAVKGAPCAARLSRPLTDGATLGLLVGGHYPRAEAQRLIAAVVYTAAV